MADTHGNVVHLGERDCSIQRNNQKIIEEAPCIAITDKVRNKMGEIVVKAAKSIGYTNAGTMEFLLDKDKNFYFMEMNTRIQVEHPITEMITDVDIIKEQIRIANGEKISFKQNDITFKGHSIECRINAENPGKNFMPTTHGVVEELHMPGGKDIRLDTGLYTRCKIPHTYDSMVAKLIVYDKTRSEAIAKMKSALSELVIDGIQTNIDFLFRILNTADYEKDNFDTAFIEKIAM